MSFRRFPGRCGYSKSGDWTKDQILLVLNANGQGARWTEITKPGLSQHQRQWKRTDGAIATWTPHGWFGITTPAYELAKSTAEARAKAAASQKPKI